MMPPFAGDPVANRNALFEKIMLVVYYGMRQVIRMMEGNVAFRDRGRSDARHTDNNDTYYLIHTYYLIRFYCVSEVSVKCVTFQHVLFSPPEKVVVCLC
jgi:hypothetical protein